jgi:SAM-dependent methyltransferase
MTDSFLSSFSQIWRGGYYEGDPRDPMARSSYGIFGWHSSLYLTYLACIKPYVNASSVVIEIGPGRGAWTNAIADLNPRHIYAVDAVPAEFSGFWNYVGSRPNIDYIVAGDFSLAGVPDQSADYFFSFGCFCHLRPEMCEAYVASLARKMKSGSRGFLMIADYDKFNACVTRHAQTSIERAFHGRRFRLVRAAYWLSVKLMRRRFIPNTLNKTSETSHVAGAWYHWGVDRACAALEKEGFKVIDRDLGASHRDPIIHFAKS